MRLPFLPRSLVTRGVFPLHERLRGRTTATWAKRLVAHEAFDQDELQRYHDAELVRHLKRAAETVPFYRERVDADAIRGPQDLLRFPILDKRTIREAGDQLRSEAWSGPVLKLQTGGSSGEPLQYLSDFERESSALAGKHRARARYGLSVGARETDLWGSPIETQAGGGLARRVSEWALGFQLLPAFELNDRVLATFRPRIEAGRADILYGYASVLARWARWLEARGERVSGVRLVVTTAETLLPADREVIARVVQAPVANEYGCRDGGHIAHEAPGATPESPPRFATNHDLNHVEVLSEAGEPLPPGEPGEACLTNLVAMAFPMIRYRLGDRITVDPEPPRGRGASAHPALLELAGRTTDLLVRPDGTEVHALAAIYLLRDVEGIDRFRVVQVSPTHLRVEFVAGPKLDREALEQKLRAGVDRILAPEVRLELAEKEAFEPLPSGKHRYVLREF